MADLFQGLVVTLREGVEAALLVALMLAALDRAGERNLRTAVYAGLAAALAASIAGGVLLQKVAVNQEMLEGSLYLAAAVMVGTMLLWMHRNVRTLSADLDARISRLKGGRLAGLWIGLFLFCFLSVFREGLETVVFLGALSFDSSGMSTLLGAALGLTMSLAFAICFIRGSLRVDLPRFFRVTTVLLAILVFQLVVHGFHELAEAGVIPSGPTIMAIVGPIVRHNAIFMGAILLIPVLLLLIPGTPKRAEPVNREDESAAQRRMGLAAHRRARRTQVIGVTSGVLIAMLLGVDTLMASREKPLSPAEPAALESGSVRLDVGGLRKEHLQRYSVSVAGAHVRFLLYRQADGRLSTALDACLMCGTKGYVQDGSSVICLNCAAEINAASIGQSGGCNPIPLKSRLEGDTVVIAEADLAAAADQFR